MIDPFQALLDLLAEPLEAIFQMIQDALTGLASELQALFDLALGSIGGAGLDLELLITQLFGDGDTFLSGLFEDGAGLIEDVLGDIADEFVEINLTGIGSIEDLLNASITTLGLVAPDMANQVKESLDGSFNSLGDIFGEITDQFELLLNPLMEEFSFFNLSIDNLTLGLTSSLSKLFDIDSEELVTMIEEVNKVTMQRRADELLRE